MLLSKVELESPFYWLALNLELIKGAENGLFLTFIYKSLAFLETFFLFFGLEVLTEKKEYEKVGEMLPARAANLASLKWYQI